MISIDDKNIWNDNKLIKIVKGDGVVVMPTDTIYGIVGKALSAFVVSRIYTIRKRALDKPCIILIGDINELEKFSISISDKQKQIFEQQHEGPLSIVLDCLDEKFTYLHRGTKTLAFRLPLQPGLRELLKETGPLIAPSANLEGFSPAQNIFEAKKYFGDSVDLYIDGGTIKGEPSKVIKLHKDGSIDVLRN